MLVSITDVYDMHVFYCGVTIQLMCSTGASEKNTSFLHSFLVF